MIYVMVGLACTSVGCEWWKPAFKEWFVTEQSCLERVADIRDKQIQFFDLKCEPLKRDAQS